MTEIKKYYDIIETTVKGTHIYYKIKCKKCNHIRESTLKGLYKHLLCGCVTGVYRNRTKEEFLETVNKNAIAGTFYTLISPYKNQSEKVLLKHSCGFIWEVRPGDVIHGRIQCPKCRRKESKGESFIRHYLQENNIPFVLEARLENSLLRFDFLISTPYKDIAIEYNGILHYEKNTYFKHTCLEDYQKRDNKKNKYCEDNNIELVIIPYYYNKSQILETLNNIQNKFNDYLNGRVEVSTSKLCPSCLEQEEDIV